MGEILLFIFVVAGGAALLYRTLFTALRLLLATSEATAAGGMAELSRRRGDLSGMAERAEVKRSARRARRRNLGLLLLWIFLLIVPIPFGWTREVYAAATLLWFLPRPPLWLRRAP